MLSYTYCFFFRRYEISHGSNSYCVLRYKKQEPLQVFLLIYLDVKIDDVWCV